MDAKPLVNPIVIGEWRSDMALFHRLNTKGMKFEVEYRGDESTKTTVSLCPACQFSGTRKRLIIRWRRIS